MPHVFRGRLYLFGIKMAEATNTPFDINPLTFSYDDFVRLSLLLNKGTPAMIKGSVLKVLKSIAFPGFAPIFRTLFPGDSQAACEFNAAVTPIFFSWLVGPARVEEGPIITRRCVHTRTSAVIDRSFRASTSPWCWYWWCSGSVENWKSTVVIEKCRYLESTACKGTCASVCKVRPTAVILKFVIRLGKADCCGWWWCRQVPTQEFFGDYLGLPVTMTPNFDNLQCVMRCDG